MNIIDNSHGIYLYNEELTVRGKFANKKTLQTYYENHRERFNLRKVCTRWCTIANESLRTLWHLYLDIKTVYCKQQLQLLRDRGEIVLSYCRYALTRFTIDMNFLVMDCRNLTKLIMRDLIYDDDILSHILTRNQNLRHVEVLGNQFITGKSLIHMSEKVHTLRVERCGYLEASHLRNALMRLKNLKRLILIGPFTNDVLSIFNEYCQNLETLKLDSSNIFCINEFLPITKLKNLRNVEIGIFNNVTESFLVNLSESCQELNRLKLYCFAYISKREMNAIASLTKLQELIIECKGINLTNPRGLHKLSISCFQEKGIVQEEQIVTVIKNSPELRYLLIYGCHSITENIFSEAKLISANRCNGVMLELVTSYKEELKEIVRKHVIFNGKIY